MATNAQTSSELSDLPATTRAAVASAPRTLPPPQRIWEIGTPHTASQPSPREASAGYAVAIAIVLFVASGAAHARLIEASGGVVDIAASMARTVAGVAVAAAIAGGVVVLARAGRRMLQRAVRWSSATFL